MWLLIILCIRHAVALSTCRSYGSRWSLAFIDLAIGLSSLLTEQDGTGWSSVLGIGNAYRLKKNHHTSIINNVNAIN